MHHFYISNKNKILYIDHSSIRERTVLPKKRKLKKAFIFIFRHLLVELRVKNSLYITFKSRLKKIVSFDKGIFRSIYNLMQIIVFPFVYIWSLLEGPYNFEAELLEISGRKAITEKKTLRMHLRNKLNDSDINYLINKQFTDIEKKHLKL